MPEAGDLLHHVISKTNLPYFPNDSVTAKEPAIIEGSNILTSQRGFLERRNGFGFYEADTTFTFSGTLKRFFSWRRWTGAAVTLSGAYFVMFNETAALVSRVWKQRVGTDVYPSLIHTDATSANPFDFVVSNDYVFFGNGVDMKKWDGTTVTNWGITGPSAALTLTSGSGALSPVIGYQWVITFGSAASLHMSSPSPIMTLTTGTTRAYTISGNTTADAQVDQVYIFRTTDGGSIYFEHPSSPITYATWIASGFADNTADSLLTTKVAPLQNQNNRPAASLGPVWFASRVWTFANDTLYYSDFEELVRGIEEEAFASTNFRSFGTEITGLSVAGQYLLVFTSDAIYRIYGDSLATFRMDTLAENKGCLNRACIARFSIENNQSSPLTSGVVAWLDTSNTVWLTNGDALTEISFPIRSDIASIVHSAAAMAYYGTGNANWLLLLSGDGLELSTRWYHESASVGAGESVYSTPIEIPNFISGGVGLGPHVIFTSYDWFCYVYNINTGTLLWSKAAGDSCYGRAQAVVLQGETNHTVFFPSHDGKIWCQNANGSNRWQQSSLYAREGGYGTSGLTPSAAVGPTATVTVAGKNWELNCFVRSTTTSGTNASVRIISGTGSGATLYEIQQVNPANRAQLLLVAATFPTVDATSRIEVVPKYPSDVYWQHAGTLTVEGGVDYLVACGFDNSVTKIRCTDGVVTAYAVNLENNEAWPLILDVGLGHSSVVFCSVEGIVRCLALSTLATEWTYTGTNGFDAVLASGLIDGVTLQIVVNGRDNKTTYLRAIDGVQLYQSADMSGDMDSGPCLILQGDGTYKVFVVGDAGLPTMLNSTASNLWQDTRGTVFNSTPQVFDVDSDGQVEILAADMDGNILAYDQDGNLIMSRVANAGVEGVPWLGNALGNGKTQFLVPTIGDSTRKGRLTCYEFTTTAVAAGTSLYVYDLDTRQWMPPWLVASSTAVQSMQTAAGTLKLFLAKANQPLAQNTAFLDAGSSYLGSLTTNLFDLVETGNPSEYGVADHVELETNAVTITTLKYLTDEDPSGATFQTAGTPIDPPHRTQGTNLVEKWYQLISDPNNKGARRMSLQLTWGAANSSFKLYGLALGYKVVDS